MLVTGKKTARFFRSLATSWQEMTPDCGAEVAELLKSRGELQPDGKWEVLWKTRNKFVLLLDLPSGRQVVYKAPLRVKNFYKYLLRLSPYGKEAANFRNLQKLDLPLVKLLAAGEDRCCFKLKSGFLVTEFAGNFANGRDFIPAVNKVNDSALTEEFIRRNLAYLGRMHRAGWAHRGFTPANLLYRVLPEPTADGDRLELRWIDLASCIKLTIFHNRRRQMVRDLSLFFHYFDFTEAETADLLTTYLTVNPALAADSLSLYKQICANPVR